MAPRWSISNPRPPARMGEGADRGEPAILFGKGLTGWWLFQPLLDVWSQKICQQARNFQSARCGKSARGLAGVRQAPFRVLAPNVVGARESFWAN